MTNINPVSSSSVPLARSSPQFADRVSPQAWGHDELASLQARAEAGGSLSPVEQGTLARLLGGSAARATATAARTPKTVADFSLSGATKQDKSDLKAALAYLQKSPAAAAFLQTVPKGTKIHIIHDGNDSYSPATKTVNWDPRSGLAVSSGKGNQSAALGLLHELDHKVNGLVHPKATGDNYDTTEEKRVITGLETKVAHQLHEPTRTDHRGAAVTLASATAHTTIAAATHRAPR